VIIDETDETNALVLLCVNDSLLYGYIEVEDKQTQPAKFMQSYLN